MSPPPNEPSLVQVLYDSLKEIKSAVNDVSEKQNTLSINVANALSRQGEIERAVQAESATREKLQAQVDALEESVHSLKRIGWILTIIGGIVVAVVTSVASDMVSNAIAGGDRRTQPTTLTQPKE